MSLNRILRSAQKLGMPVVITDRNGADAQVVLPFDDFMALAGASSQGEKHGIASGSLDDLDVTDLARGADAADADWDLSGFGSSDFTIGADGNVESDFPTTPAESREALDVPEAEGGAGMEERFYLEPLDELDQLK